VASSPERSWLTLAHRDNRDDMLCHDFQTGKK
jgi:hypothetical protein